MRAIPGLLSILFTIAFVQRVESTPIHAVEDEVSPVRAASGAKIPSLDQMAGDWVPMKDLGYPPAVHNFHEMIGVNRDLVSFIFRPPPKRDPQLQIKLLINGMEYPATETRWFAYRALRRNLDCDGLAIETDTRMINEKLGVLCSLTATNTTSHPVKATIALRVHGLLQADGVGITNCPNTSGCVEVLRPMVKPDAAVSEPQAVSWTWTIEVPPGGKKMLGYVFANDIVAHAASVDKEASAWASNFDAAMAECRTRWQQRWIDAFTPGNNHFSGNLPVLATNDSALMRNYYMGALTILILERTQFPVTPRAFVTSGERTAGTQYYWDASMQATAWALLEPEGMKAVLRRWLVQNARSGVAIDLNDTHGFDPIYYNNITGYAFNAFTIFKTADEYLRVTGDLAFLDDKLEDGKTVLNHMDAFATDWETLPKGPKGLVDYNGNRNLLECAPAYINCVPSLNAQDVWMMRRMAQWHTLHGELARANELEEKASAFLPAVLGLYKTGDGVWNCYHSDGSLVELRHCVDYIYCGNALQDDLTQAQESEMNGFVKNELFMRDWMRAMSPRDAAAARSDRPDHGPMGAYDGWIPLTVGAMWRLGDPVDAYKFYDRTATVTKEGPFAQAHEFHGLDKMNFDAPVRIAQRRGCEKECISGGAFTDVVINTFFGFSPSPGGKSLITDPQTPRPFQGTLSAVRYGGKVWQITASARGIQISPNPVKSP
jgi:hypothetical protein